MVEEKKNWMEQCAREWFPTILATCAQLKASAVNKLQPFPRFILESNYLLWYETRRLCDQMPLTVEETEQDYLGLLPESRDWEKDQGGFDPVEQEEIPPEYLLRFRLRQSSTKSLYTPRDVRSLKNVLERCRYQNTPFLDPGLCLPHGRETIEAIDAHPWSKAFSVSTLRAQLEADKRAETKKMIEDDAKFAAELHQAAQPHPSHSFAFPHHHHHHHQAQDQFVFLDDEQSLLPASEGSQLHGFHEFFHSLANVQRCIDTTYLRLFTTTVSESERLDLLAVLSHYQHQKRSILASLHVA